MRRCKLIIVRVAPNRGALKIPMIKPYKTNAARKL